MTTTEVDGQLLPSAQWRMMAQGTAETTHWLCRQCGLASPVGVGDERGHEFCQNSSCGAPPALMERSGCPEEARAMTELRGASCYGRSLKFLGHRGQVSALACGAQPGTPGFTEAVRQHGMQVFRAGEHVEVDPRPREAAATRTKAIPSGAVL